MKNLCVNFLPSCIHFSLTSWGGADKIVWANLLTTMIYQGGFTIEGNSPLFGNVVTTFWGVDGGSKNFRSHFQYNSACEPFVRSTFFCQGQNPAPFLAMPVFSFPSLPFPSHKQLTLILFTQVGIWIYPRILGEGTQIDCSFLLSSNM